MGEVPIITKLGEDGLIQPQCADHPSRRQFKHLPHRLHQYIVPVLTTAMGIDIHGDWISFADGIGQADCTLLCQTCRYDVAMYLAI